MAKPASSSSVSSESLSVSTPISTPITATSNAVSSQIGSTTVPSTGKIATIVSENNETKPISQPTQPTSATSNPADSSTKSNNSAVSNPSASSIASSASTSSSANSNVEAFTSGFSIKSIDDLNCKIKANDSTCNVCYDSYYYSVQYKLCVPVSPLCKTWNKLGECLSCYDGYELSQTICATAGTTKVVQSAPLTLDPNCFEFSGSICKKCAYRFYFNK